LYLKLLNGILDGHRIDHGKQGYYLASSGSIKWRDLYSSFAQALAKRGVVQDGDVQPADDEALAQMAQALRCPNEMVQLQLGGQYVLP
jgi:hypothetical protein